MKKMTAAFLVLVMCLGLCACRGGGEGAAQKPGKEILGQWKSLNAMSLEFKENGSGIQCFRGKESEFTWKYDEELSVYVLALTGGNFNATLKEEDGTIYLAASGEKFYTPEAFQSKLPAYMEQARTKVAEETSSREKYEFGKVYSTENISVTFDLKMEDGLWLYASITNNGNESITLENYGSDYCPIYYGYRVSYYSMGQWGGSLGGVGLTPVFEGDIQSIEPGQSGIIKTKLCDDLQYVIDYYGELIGYVSCDVGSWEENGYLDFSDKFGK